MNFTPDIIDHAATLSIGKVSPMAYMNKVLAGFRKAKVTTIAQAKATNYAPPVAANFIKHSYSNAELNSLFANIEEVKF